MKKHHLILICFFGFLILWICCVFYVFRSSEGFWLLLLGLNYLGVLSLLSCIVIFNKYLNTTEKLGWILLGLFLTPILPLIYSFKYRDEIQRIIDDTTMKMKEGPKSLSEFNARSDR